MSRIIIGGEVVGEWEGDTLIIKHRENGRSILRVYTITPERITVTVRGKTEPVTVPETWREKVA
jgi:hypothetical protein